MITLETRLTIPKEVLFRELDGEAVLLEMRTGQYYGLNQVGTRVWQLLLQHGEVGLLRRALLDEYEVTGDRLGCELLGFVETLASRGLVEVA
jgi:hypothetical protein